MFCQCIPTHHNCVYVMPIVNNSVPKQNIINPKVHVYKGKYKYGQRCRTHQRITPKYAQKVFDYDENGSSGEITVIQKVFVFDLDETLGCFTELYTLWRFLFISPQTYQTLERDRQIIFNELLDLYPEFLRYNILVLLRYIYDQVCLGRCRKIYIYTNNQCQYLDWVKHIVCYLDAKITDGKNALFERPICAFKIGNRTVEPHRTTRDKTYDDLVHCALFPRTTEVCFLDDKYCQKMIHEKVYYIQPPPYYHNLSYTEIYARLVGSALLVKLEKKGVLCRSSLVSPFYYSQIPPHKILSMDENAQVYSKMMYYIREFLFTRSKHQTRKRKYKIGRFTFKKRK